MKRCILVRCLLVIAVLSPALLALGQTPPGQSTRPNAPERNWDDEFQEFYSGIRPGERTYELERDHRFRHEKLTDEEVGLVVQTIVDLEVDDPLWTEWWQGTDRNSLVLHYLLSGRGRWVKQLHPMDDSKQIWMQLTNDGSGEGERVTFKMKTGF